METKEQPEDDIFLQESAKKKFQSAAIKAVRKNAAEEKSVPTFDTSLFERKVQPPTGYVTPEGRVILTKEPDDRTEDELDIVEEEIQQMAFFQRFPYTLLRELSRILRFQEYSERQLILREGHEPLAMYIIIAGVVSVFREKGNLKTGRTRAIKLEELSHGMQFGAHSLLYGTRRTTNVICKTPTQLLQLKKDDFATLLKDILLQDEMLKEKSLRSIKCLAEFDWEEKEYENLNKCAKLGKFPPHTIILGGICDVPYYVHFITVGECAVEQEVEFYVEHNLGYNRLRPIPSTSDSSCVPSKVFKKRIEICRLVQGHYFGFGEDTSQRFYRSLELVKTIMIPRHVLLEKHPKIFDKLKEHFENSFPPLQDILDKYQEVLNWEKFTARVTRQVSGDFYNVDSKSDSRPPFVKYF